MLRFLCGVLAGTAIALPVCADTAPIPNQYAFDQPELLADQLVWGVAHGVQLLGRRCAQSGQREAAQAWLSWQEREAGIIHAMHERLAHYYFRQSEVEPGTVAKAIGLKAQLDLADEELEATCATLAEALQHSRYDLSGRRAALLKP